MVMFIGAATALYLFLQLSLNASIIDLIAPSYEGVSLERIINLSELATGFGLGLLITRLFVAGKKHWKVNIRIGLSLGVILICMLALPPIQRVIVDQWVNARSPQDQRMAIVLSAVQYGLSTGSLELTDIGLDGKHVDKPEYRTAVIFITPLIFLLGKSEAFQASAPTLAARGLYQNRESFQPYFLQGQKKTCDAFNTGYMKYEEVSELAETYGIFDFIVQNKYREWRIGYFGYDAPVSLGMSRRQLIRSTPVQKKVRGVIFDEVLKAPLSSQITHVVSRQEMIKYLEALFARKILLPCASWSDFRENFVEPAVRDVEESFAKLLSSDQSIDSVFGNVGEEISRRAIYAAVAPPLGLVMTLLISALALLSFIGFMLRYQPLCSKITTIMILGSIIIVLALGPLLATNPVISHPAYQAQWQKLRADGSGVTYVLGGAIEWTLRTAPLLYPLYSAKQKSN